MGAISIGLPRGSITARLDGMVFHNGQWPLVCFLYHCYGLSIDSADDDATICPGSEIRKDRGIRVCRGITLTRAFSLVRILQQKKEYMGYMGNYRHLGQTAAEIQARLPARLHARCGAAGQAACHLPSDSPFRLQSNYAVPSGLYGHPASACRATARRGRTLGA